MNKTNAKNWDANYEWKTVLLLGLGFGLVSIDRFLIVSLFPVMKEDLGLSFQDIGYITGILAIAWGVSSLFMGRLSDRFGHRAVIIPAVLAFSLLAGFSGLVTGLISLLIIRAAIGIAEGAYTPPSIVATMNASKPSRQGMNVGLQQASMPLMGLGLGPIFATQMLKVVEWHWIFAMVIIPGIIVAYLLFKVLRNADTEIDANTAAAHISTDDATEHKWADVFRVRNVPLNMLGMLCWLTSLIVLSAFLPSYLIEYLGLSVEQMGFVLSAVGFGGALGSIVMPAISDRIGRKPVAVIAVLGAMASIYMLIQSGPNTTQLFLTLFATVFFNFSLICLTVGPLTAEAVPARLMTTASGFVIGFGEICGGGILPGVAGFVADKYGIENTLFLAFGAMGVGLLVALSLKETAPVRVDKTLIPTR